jgi:hypothetical protein
MSLSAGAHQARLGWSRKLRRKRRPPGRHGSGLPQQGGDGHLEALEQSRAGTLAGKCNDKHYKQQVQRRWLRYGETGGIANPTEIWCEHDAPTNIPEAPAVAFDESIHTRY